MGPQIVALQGVGVSVVRGKCAVEVRSLRVAELGWWSEIFGWYFDGDIRVVTGIWLHCVREKNKRV
jgi:hypothetical protein